MTAMSTDDRPTGYLPRLDAIGRPVASDAIDPQDGVIIEWPRYYPEEIDAERAERHTATTFDEQSNTDQQQLLENILDGLQQLNLNEGEHP